MTIAKKTFCFCQRQLPYRPVQQKHKLLCGPFKSYFLQTVHVLDLLLPLVISTRSVIIVFSSTFPLEVLFFHILLLKLNYILIN